MHDGRPRQKDGQKSGRKRRYSLAERHAMGISATARAAARRAEKAAAKAAAKKA